MAKKAFIIGKNTKSLRWSERDAELMNEALSTNGYEITKIEPTIGKYDILKYFDLFIKDVAQTDTIIFYFSGHAYTPKGELSMVIGNDLQDPISILDASYFTDAFNKSDAEIKLVVLDCCRANKEGKNWKPEFGNEKYRLLTSSESLSQSKEIDDLSASLMTFFLHKALTDDIFKIADNDKFVRIEKVYKWLVEDIKVYNKERNLPIPSLLGDQKLNFNIAKVKQTEVEKEKQKAYFDKLWDIHDNLIFDLKYWQGKLVRAEQHNDEITITECNVQISSLSKKIANKKLEIAGWQDKFNKEKLENVNLYEGIKLKLIDYTELPEADNNFVGRENIIKQVFNRILSKKKIAVTGIKGMGGIGKTAITVEICNYIKESWEDNPTYPEYLKDIMGVEKYFEHGILWIRFERKEPLTLLLHDKIATQLGIKYPANSQPKEILKDLTTILKLRKYRNKILIILDSAEQNPRNFETIFRSFSDLPILVTSRENMDIESIDINLLDIKDAIQLFKNHYLDDKNQILTELQIEQTEVLCKEVGYLPIAIKLLAKRAKRYSKNIDTVIEEFREKRLEILNAKILTEPEKKNEDAIICFKMSYDDECLNDVIKDVFMRCGLFYLPFEKSKIASAYEKDDITFALDELVRISLIEYDKERRKYYLHPLMREFAIKNAIETGIIEALYEWHKNNFLNQNIMDYSSVNELNDTIIEIFQTVEYFRKQDNVDAQKTVIEFTEKHHESLFYKGYWERAISLLDLGIDASDKLNDKEKHGSFIQYKADIVGRQGKNEQAIVLFQRALKIQEKENYFIRYSLNSISYRMNEILKAIKDNFDNSRKAYLANSSHVFSMIRTVGWIYRDFNLPFAEKLAIVNLKKEGFEQRFQKDNFIKSIHDLINIKRSKGYYNECIEYINELLKYANEVQTSEMIAALTDDLVEAYLDLGDLDNAQIHLIDYEKIISKMGLLNVFRHINFLKGRIEFLKGNYEKALTYFEHIEKKHFKDYWFGKTYIHISGQIEEAELLLISALKHFQNKKDALGIAMVYTELALCEYKKEHGKLIKAVEYITLAINTKKQYSIIDLKEEEEIKKIISRKDAATYEFLEKNFIDKYIDVLPEFLISDLPTEIIVSNREEAISKKMLLIPEGVCFVSEQLNIDIVVYNSDYILKNIKDFLSGFYHQRLQATELYLYPYYIDKYPVTNIEYNRFCTATKRKKPEHWIGDFDNDFSFKPVVGITYSDAEAYANWLGKELPTRAEWEKAFSEKNIPFLDIDLFQQNKNSYILEDIVRKNPLLKNDKEEIFKFLVGNDIYEYLTNNQSILKNWESEQKEKVYGLGDFNNYQASVYDELTKSVDEKIRKKINWKRLINLIAYSNGTSGVQKKIDILNHFPKLKEKQLAKLYSIYINEAIELYRIQSEKSTVIADYIKERNYWIIAVKSVLGLKSVFDTARIYQSEFIADKKTIAIREKDEIEQIKVTDIDVNYSNTETGFRCVKPIYSNDNYKTFVEPLK